MNDDHGDPGRTITLKRLQAAARDAGISVDQAARNMVDTVALVDGAVKASDGTTMTCPVHGVVRHVKGGCPKCYAEGVDVEGPKRAGSRRETGATQAPITKEAPMGKKEQQIAELEAIIAKAKLQKAHIEAGSSVNLAGSGSRSTVPVSSVYGDALAQTRANAAMKEFDNRVAAARSAVKAAGENEFAKARAKADLESALRSRMTAKLIAQANDPRQQRSRFGPNSTDLFRGSTLTPSIENDMQVGGY